MRGHRLAALALALAGAAGCDLYIRLEQVDAAFNDGRPPADAVELDAPNPIDAALAIDAAPASDGPAEDGPAEIDAPGPST